MREVMEKLIEIINEISENVCNYSIIVACHYLAVSIESGLNPS